jgi:glucosamine-6-phosphate deaminase
MLVHIKETYAEVSKAGARIAAELLRKKPNCVLGFATGGTPLGMYKELIRMHKDYENK